VRDSFQRMLAAGASVAIAGKVGKGDNERFLELITAPSVIR
jgi:hypothetical protein